MTTAADLADRVVAAERAGLVLDFDGTLAPIVADPETSALPPRLVPVLAGLAARLPLVAVVSGRPVAFLAERVDVAGVRLLGLYGLEQWLDGRRVVRPEAAVWQEAVDRARRRLREAVAGRDGVVVEDKGLAVAVHFRNAPDRAAAAEAVAEAVAAVAADTGLRREPGKLVEELRPPVDVDKGAGVRALAQELGLDVVVYVGDDLGDLPAFAAARDLGGGAIAVDHGAETPAAVRDAADAVLDGTDAVADWLTALRDHLA
ncbi:MAG TPA: trehalose-phosphatase [Egibacteraceae bacterium]